MENYKQKILYTLSKNKNRYNKSSKKICINQYKSNKPKILSSNKINKLIFNKIRLNIQRGKRNSNSNSQKKKTIINHNLSDYKFISHKKNLSLNNESNNQISRLKSKFFYNFNKDLNIKKAHKNEKIDYSLTNCNLIKNKLCKKNKNENTIINEKNLFCYNTNYNNYLNNTNFNPFKMNNQESKLKLNHFTQNSNSLIFKRNKSLLKLNTYNNLEIICEGINNSIENHIKPINIHYIKNKSKLSDISFKIKNDYMENLKNKKNKKKKNNSFMMLTSINNNNYTNIINYNLSRKKLSKKKKTKINKIQNKTLNEKEIKDKLKKLKINLEKLIEEKSSNSKKYNIIKDKFNESINIMRLNLEEKNFLKLIMNKYNDVISSYSKENKNLKNESKKFENLNAILDKKYMDLKKEFNQNIKLLKQFDKNENNDIKDNIYDDNQIL